MHPLAPPVEDYLTASPREDAPALRTWFSMFTPDVQEILLERARRKGTVAVLFRERALPLGRLA